MYSMGGPLFIFTLEFETEKDVVRDKTFYSIWGLNHAGTYVPRPIQHMLSSELLLQTKK